MTSKTLAYMVLSIMPQKAITERTESFVAASVICALMAVCQFWPKLGEWRGVFDLLDKQAKVELPAIQKRFCELDCDLNKLDKTLHDAAIQLKTLRDCIPRTDPPTSSSLRIPSVRLVSNGELLSHQTG